MAEALLSEYLGDAVLGHPGLMAVPETVGSEPLSDTEPAGKRCVRGRRFPAAGAVAGTGLVGDGAPVEGQRHRVPARWAVPGVVRTDQPSYALSGRRHKRMPSHRSRPARDWDTWPNRGIHDHQLASVISPIA